MWRYRGFCFSGRKFPCDLTLKKRLGLWASALQLRSERISVHFRLISPCTPYHIPHIVSRTTLKQDLSLFLFKEASTKCFTEIKNITDEQGLSFLASVVLGHRTSVVEYANALGLQPHTQGCTFEARFPAGHFFRVRACSIVAPHKTFNREVAGSSPSAATGYDCCLFLPCRFDIKYPWLEANEHSCCFTRLSVKCSQIF